MEHNSKIAIASMDNEGLDGEVSGHFGRCPYYTLVKLEQGQVAEISIVPNPYFQRHAPGVMPRFVRGLDADVILAGGMGPRAIQMFGDFGIQVVTGAVGQVSKVLGAYLSGKLAGIVPCQHDHPESCGSHGAGGQHHG